MTVRYDQTGYLGSSMSVRAQEAYNNGEMPKSKWSKKAMITAIKDFCIDEEIQYDEAISKMKKDEIFDTFFEKTGWHHTSKYANETDFYGINEDAVWAALAPDLEPPW